MKGFDFFRLEGYILIKNFRSYSTPLFESFNKIILFIYFAEVFI